MLAEERSESFDKTKVKLKEIPVKKKLLIKSFANGVKLLFGFILHLINCFSQLHF